MTDKYLFLNSNICFPAEGGINFDTFMNNINYNTGNSYITYSVIKSLFGKFQQVDDIKNLWFYQPTQIEIDRINSEYSKVILILQDNLRLFDSYLHHDIYAGLANFFRKLKIPIVVFSLGSNCFDKNWRSLKDGLNKNLVSLLRIIADNTVSFGIRGDFTSEILNSLGIKNHQVIGCPSYFEMGRNRVINKPNLKPDFTVLSGGNFSHKSHNDIFYVLQDESLLIKSIAFPNERLLRKDFDSIGEVLTSAYLHNKVAVFSSMDRWKEFDKRFDFYIGSRVHGAIMAMNAGLPAIVTNGDTRAEEMCNYFGIPQMTNLSDECDLRMLYEDYNVDTVNKKYNHLYDNYVGWIKSNGLDVVSSNDDMIEDNQGLKYGKTPNCIGDYEISSEVVEGFLSCYRTKHRSKKLIIFSRLISCFVIGKKNRKKVRHKIIERFKHL